MFGIPTFAELIVILAIMTLLFGPDGIRHRLGFRP